MLEDSLEFKMILKIQKIDLSLSNIKSYLSRKIIWIFEISNMCNHKNWYGLKIKKKTKLKYSPPYIVSKGKNANAYNNEKKNGLVRN